MDIVASAILAALVTGFLAQVVSNDTITQPFRDWVERHTWNDTAPRKAVVFFHDLISCYRCSGVWLSIPATALVLGAWPWTGGWDGLRTFAVVAMAASFSQFWLMTWIFHSPNNRRNTEWEGN